MISGLRLLWPYLRPHRRALLVGVLAMLGEIVTALVAPIPLQWIIDVVVGRLRRHGPPLAVSPHIVRQLVLLAVLAVLVAALDAAFTYLDARQMARVSQKATTELRRALFGHVQRLSLSFHRDRHTRAGDLLLRLGGDVQSLQDATSTAPGNLVTNGGTALLMAVLLFLVDPRIGALVLAFSLPLFALVRHHHTRLKQVVRLTRRQEGRVSSMVSESLGAATLVKAFGREDAEMRRLHEETQVSLAHGLRAAEYQARSQPLVALVSSLCLAAVLLVGAFLAVQRTITVGELTLIAAYTKGVFGSLRQLAKLSTQSPKVSAAAERVADLLAQAPEVTDPSRPTPLPRGRCLDVSFQGVSVGYRPGRAVLRNLTLDIPAGSTTAIVGSTGAGKSTLLSLVPRFYDVWSGSVRIGGVDVRNVSLDELRSSILLVLQETLLLRDTLWNNLAYGRPEASRAEILAAAEAAGMMAFVDDLEDGFDTVVSERGASLSGGQRQCVAIARAMLRNTPIVLLDEPTSGLDALTEQLVVDGMRRLVATRTAIIIAHRFSTIRHADLVAVIEDGRVVQTGRPAELGRVSGLFDRLQQIG